MKLFPESPIIKKIIYGIACAFVYGGAVNYGGFDFLPAIPFLIYILIAAFKWRRAYTLVTSLFLLVCVTLYYLKNVHGNLFHPNSGKEFFFTQDVCLTEYRTNSERFVLVSELRQDQPCNSSNMGDAVRWQIFKKEKKLNIKRISVSNADFGESYVIHAETEIGEVVIYKDTFLSWPDGRRIEQADLRRSIFYFPSLLMYWPISPVLFFTILKK